MAQTREHPQGRYLLTLCLGALGVVFGDLGTSPLYALRESFHPGYGLAPTPANVLGIVSLILWSLVLVISVKYLVFVMKADNKGEGGIIALTALVAPHIEAPRGRRTKLVLMGLFGAALLYGDGMITPSISVLSAVEGLDVATHLFRPYIVPITVAILVALFAVQSRGTGRVGRVFGPIMLLWMATLALLGVRSIFAYPAVLAAVNPWYAVAFFLRNHWHGFLVLGSVVLALTGAETLYADMGHFGKRPIRLTWFAVVLPALVLNYFGQGALILRQPRAAEQPFFHLAPSWALYPLVALATTATIIASQAVISGAFSLTVQAVQLGYLPRLEIEHTSERERGQIYIPSVNWVLMLTCIGLVLGFRSSSNLAAAYGVAVTTDFVFTTILFSVVARTRFGWSLTTVVLLASLFLVPDLAFWAANMLKIPSGGWFPLVVAATVYTVMTTWKRGREILRHRLKVGELPFDVFAAQMKAHPPTRVSGTAVFMYGNPETTPPALLHNLKHNKVLHERVILLMVRTEDVPHVPAGERVRVQEIGNGFYRVLVCYGFMEDPDVPAAMRLAKSQGLTIRPMETTYFLGRENLIATRRRRGMAVWREKLFSTMSRNARGAASFFRLPPNRVVELGAQIEL
ncbi:MAG TPA: potassium transporter Kup [Longimicrobiaceae bacterium]|nr:potassium transporter Kup [Longimicrobiaceae bacterium]